jgi:hypothetical protein
MCLDQGSWWSMPIKVVQKVPENALLASGKKKEFAKIVQAVYNVEELHTDLRLHTLESVGSCVKTVGFQKRQLNCMPSIVCRTS